MFAIGLDIGSTGTKTLVLRDGEPLAELVRPTGWNSGEAAAAVAEELRERGIDPAEWPCVATGYGRISVPFARRTVTEITCHARGAAALFGLDRGTVVDIGGQDTKVIRLENGAAADFLMNDKCSAGTGRFLEVMANTMGISPGELCRLAEGGGGVEISSMCTVFAESEVISLIGRGESRENIAHAVVRSIVRKVAAQFRRLEGGGPVCLTGGMCQCGSLVSALAEELGTPVATCPRARFAGALGAALLAESLGKNG